MKEILKRASQLLEPHGFVRQKHQFLRLQNNLLQGIGFDFAGARFYCTVYILPAYMGAENLHYTYGNRLEYITGHPVDLERDLAETVLPYFDEVSTPERLLYVLRWKPQRAKKFLCCPPVDLQRLKLYTAMYLGKDVSRPLQKTKQALSQCTHLSRAVLDRLHGELVELEALQTAPPNEREAYFQRNIIAFTA